MSRNNLFQAVFYDSGIPQVIYDLDGKVVEANPAFCALLRHEDLCGQDSDVFVAEEEDTDARIIAKALEERSPFLTHRQFLKSDGSRVWAGVHFTAVYEDGAMKYIVGQITDLSAQHALEVDVQRRKEEGERFSSIIAHDLREPIGTMAGYASLIRRRCVGQLSTEGDHWLEEIILGAKQMAAKIDDLLAFSRVGQNVPHSPFALADAVEEAKRAVGRSARESGATFVVEGALPLAVGDRSMIAQVFQNLFSNSIKYRGMEAPRVTIRGETSTGGIVTIAVSDNGLGFHPKFKDKIFGIFQRLYTAEEYPGTGIGLALAKKIVEKHGGSIWGDSEPGHGSTFTFTLPSPP